MKRIIIFYRGSDDSNKIASATTNKIVNTLKKEDFEIEIVNLDKRNFKKFFDKINDNYKEYELYIYSDEENLLDYIKDNFKDANYKTYSLEECKIKGYKPNYLSLANKIIEDYKKESGIIELWKVNKDSIEKLEVYKCDYDCNYIYKNKFKYHTSEYLARSYLRDTLVEDIEIKKKTIEYLKKGIKEEEILLEELENLLK